MTAQQLKNSILQMAVQGKLVPQDPNDEPASALLERIRAEKEALIKDGKIKRDKRESVIVMRDRILYEIVDGKERCIADEVPFEIPESWEWCRLGNICKIARGGSPRPIKQYLTEDSNGINWIKIGDSDKGGKYINETKEKIIPEGMSKSRFVHKGDFLLTNSMSFGRPYILNVDGCIHDGWLVLSDYQVAYDKDFLYYMLSSTFAYYQFCDVVSGAVVKNLNSDKVANALFPLPPLAEQHRIVAKIEELLPFIEQYKQAENQLTSLNATFPEDLKKSILQEAVQGKLVPQDPNDEPASVLLERIRAEKRSLIKAGKLKKDKHESVIVMRDRIPYEIVDGKERCIADEVPFEIPESWEWCRLENIFITSSGSTPLKSETEYWTNGIHNWVRTTDLNNDVLSECEIKISNKALNECNLNFLPLNSVCIAMYGGAGTIGKNALINFKTTINQSVCAIHASGYCDMKYVLYYFQYYRKYWMDYASGSRKDPNINKVIINHTLFPLPPLAEQHRIVAKIEELMPFINAISS